MTQATIIKPSAPIIHVPNFAELRPIPAPGTINSKLTYLRPETIQQIFDLPGELPADCTGLPTNAPRLRAVLITANVGPFTVTGSRPAIASLQRICARIKRDNPALYASLGTAGMLCYRHIRGEPGKPSNHAPGLAIDLTFNRQLLPLNSPHVQLGLLLVYPYFHAEGWFSGCQWDRPDGMHLEMADETVRQLHALGQFAA